MVFLMAEHDFLTSSTVTPSESRYPTAHRTVRSFVVFNGENDVTYVIATDACAVLGIAGSVEQACETLATTHSLAVQVMENGAAVHRIAVTLEGVAALARSRDGDPEAERFTRWTQRALRPRRTADPSATRWGWQPLKELVRAAGHSGRTFVEALNALELDVPPVTLSSYAAWTYGASVPDESLLRRAEVVLQRPREELFTPEVLASLNTKRRRRSAGDPPASPVGSSTVDWDGTGPETGVSV